MCVNMCVIYLPTDISSSLIVSLCLNNVKAYVDNCCGLLLQSQGNN